MGEKTIVVGSGNRFAAGISRRIRRVAGTFRRVVVGTFADLLSERVPNGIFAGSFEFDRAIGAGGNRRIVESGRDAAWIRQNNNHVALYFVGVIDRKQAVRRFGRGDGASGNRFVGFRKIGVVIQRTVGGNLSGGNVVVPMFER